MIAAAAAFLYLLPLAALPIVFHLLMRRRRRKLLFSTLMFFHRVDPRLSARRRLQQWLLLLARVLLIATVLLGLARLTIKSYGGVLGLGGKQSVVVLVDNSASMDAPGPGGQRTKLRIAVESARALLANLDADA
ncbi:MAG: BatA domain-containing protein, partial [Planctomycetota bacterium]